MRKEKNQLYEIFQEYDFSFSEIEEIVSLFQLVHFKKNELIQKEGKIANNYYYLNSGFARSYVVDTDGNEVTTNLFSPKNIMLDMSSFFLKEFSIENYQAITDISCWKTTFENAQYLFHNMRNFRESGRARLVQEYHHLKTRSIAMITSPAKERYINLVKTNPELILNIPLKYIASYLGITDATLSRIRKEYVGK